MQENGDKQMADLIDQEQLFVQITHPVLDMPNQTNLLKAI